MHKVLVIGCNTGGLAVIRAFLDAEDVQVIALSHSRREVGLASRYVSEIVMMPHPGDDEQGFIDLLLARGERWRGALIIEVGDYLATALAKHKRVLSQYYRMATPDWDCLRLFVDKAETRALAQRIGVDHPRVFAPQSVEHARSMQHDIRYPALVKPISSHEFVRATGFKNFEVNSGSELMERLRYCWQARQPVIVQEVVPGPETNLERVHLYVNSKGRIAAQFFHRKIRQHPPGFGVMRVGLSTPPNSDVELLAGRIVAGSNYRGFCSIEFKRDPRDGALKLIEVNARMPRSAAFPIACGVNFPWLMYKDLVHNEQIEVTQHAAGLYWIELLPDLFNMLFNRRRERFTWREYLRPYLARRRHFAVLDWRDPLPFLKQISSACGAALRLLTRLLRNLLQRRRRPASPTDPLAPAVNPKRLTRNPEPLT